MIYSHKTYLLILALCAGIIFNPTFAQTTTLSVTIKDVKTKKAEWLIVKRFAGEGTTAIDSVKFKTDTTLTFKLIKPNGLYTLEIKGSGNVGEFIATPAEPTLTSINNYSDLLNGNVSIDNSKENQAYAAYAKLVADYTPILQSLADSLELVSFYTPDYKRRMVQAEADVEVNQNAYNLALQSIALTYPNTFTATVLVPLEQIPLRTDNKDIGKQFDGFRGFLNKHYFDRVNFNDERIVNHPAFRDKILSYITTYNEKSTDGIIQGLDVIFEQLKTNQAVNEFVFNFLIKQFLGTKSDRLLKHVMSKDVLGCSLDLTAQDLAKLNSRMNTQVGAQAPDILLYDTEGEPQSLLQVAKGNKYTVLFIWVSWCVRCKKEAPLIGAMFDKYRKQGLGLYSVSLDSNKDDWTKALAEHGIKGTNVSELVDIKKSTIIPNYNLSTTPAVFVVDKQGKIVAKALYGTDLEAFLKGVLAK